MIRRVAASLLLALTPVGAAAQTTHRFQPDHWFNTYSFAHAPALRIAPGDRVITTTVDAGGSDAAGRAVTTGPNPQTGPFYIEGAQPGDMIAVTFHRIETNRATAYSGTLISAYAIDPGYLRSAAAETETRRETWALDRARGMARTTTDGLLGGPIEVPMRPMLGCVAVAPGRKEAIGTTTPGNFGGNMDYAGLVQGVTVMLPVYEPGALLFVGDGHAAQGHGEVVGTGLETSMDVEFSVQLIKGKAIAQPRLESDQYIMVAASARPLLEAFQRATTELMQWLRTDYGMDERSASMLLGVAAEYEIANVVDPAFTVVAKIDRVDPTTTAWVDDEDVNEYGNTGSVPLVVQPPINGNTPTPGPLWMPTPLPACTTTPTATPTATPTSTPTVTPTVVGVQATGNESNGTEGGTVATTPETPELVTAPPSATPYILPAVGAGLLGLGLVVGLLARRSGRATPDTDTNTTETSSDADSG